MNDFLKLLKDLKVRVTMEYDSRLNGIRLYLSQEQPNRQRRGMERCWSIVQLANLRYPQDFIDHELKDFLECFNGNGQEQKKDDSHRVARKGK